MGDSRSGPLADPANQAQLGSGLAYLEGSEPMSHLIHDAEDERRHAQWLRSLASEITTMLPHDRREAYGIIQMVLDILQMPVRPPLDGPPRVPELPAA
jgi:hypothetical protein